MGTGLAAQLLTLAITTSCFCSSLIVAVKYFRKFLKCEASLCTRRGVVGNRPFNPGDVNYTVMVVEGLNGK